MSDLKSINPVNGDIVGVYPQISNQEMDQIIIDAENEFHSWRKIPIKERCQYFKFLADTILIRKDELAQLAIKEYGQEIMTPSAGVEDEGFTVPSPSPAEGEVADSPAAVPFSDDDIPF